MLALSMVVITGLIGAPGLGRNLTNALSKVNVGAAFEAGLAIVILAIILDRLTFAAGEWLDPRIRRAQHRPGGAGSSRSARRSLILGAGLLAPLVVDATSFPDAISVSVQDPVNAFVGWVTDTFSGVTIAIKDAITNCRPQPARDAADGARRGGSSSPSSPWSRGTCPAAGRRSSPRSASA